MILEVRNTLNMKMLCKNNLRKNHLIQIILFIDNQDDSVALSVE